MAKLEMAKISFLKKKQCEMKFKGQIVFTCSRLRRIWSRTHLIPGLPVPDFPSQFGPHISGSPQPVPLDKRNILGTICLGGPNWLGTICPGGQNFWGPFVHGDRIGWGPFVQRDQSIGDQLWGTKCPGTICVWDQFLPFDASHTQSFN